MKSLDINKTETEINLVMSFFQEKKDKFEKFKNIFEIWKDEKLGIFLESCSWFKLLKKQDKILFLAAIGEQIDLTFSQRNYPNELQKGYIFLKVCFNGGNSGLEIDKSIDLLINIVGEDGNRTPYQAGFSSFNKLFKSIKELNIYKDNVEIYKLFLKHKESIVPQLDRYFSDNSVILNDTQKNLADAIK